MLNLIVIIIFFVGLLGMAIILLRKIPTLCQLGECQPLGLFTRIKHRIVNHDRVRSFSFEVFLQKILSKIRILTLKTENKMGHCLSELRIKSIENKNGFSQEYWEKMKKKKDLK